MAELEVLAELPPHLQPHFVAFVLSHLRVSATQVPVLTGLCQVPSILRDFLLASPLAWKAPLQANCTYPTKLASMSPLLGTPSWFPKQTAVGHSLGTWYLSFIGFILEFKSLCHCLVLFPLLNVRSVRQGQPLFSTALFTIAWKYSYKFTPQCIFVE